MSSRKYPGVLFFIVIAQFLCTSLWFAGNAVMLNLVQNFNLPGNALGHITSSVQFGFILGTLLFAFFSIADRYSPSKVFFISALLGALFNVAIIFGEQGLISILTLRFFTGFFLAGIYPVGMKIAADYFQKGLGKSLGFLVGALVLGTALPHLIKDLSIGLNWEYVIVSTSILAVIGGLLILVFVKDGPYRRSSSQFNIRSIYSVFKVRAFRAASFGYFGHMWELYAFWAFVPVILMNFNAGHPETLLNVELYSFLIIGIGGLACVLGGYLAQRFGTKRIALIALSLSGICCLLSPFLLETSAPLLLLFLFFWGSAVIADSPLFSTLVAQNADAQIKGTALTIVNSIGFTITIISIQVINILSTRLPIDYLFVVLGVGPLFGVLALRRIRF